MYFIKLKKKDFIIYKLRLQYSLIVKMYSIDDMIY